MKTKLTLTQLLCLISIAILIAIGCHNNRQEAFQHTRDSLIIDSLRNPVDTTEFLTEHSEIKH